MESKLAMYLVAYHTHTMLLAQFGNMCQLFPTPHTSARVMRIAEQHYPRTLMRELSVQVFKIHLISQRLLVVYKRIAHHLAAIVAYGGIEAVVDGTLHYHLVARQCQRLDDGRYCRHHSRSVDYVAPIY